MDAMVEICVVLFIVIVVLFFRNKNLKNDRKELKELLKKREEVIKKGLIVLESFKEYYVDCDAEPLKIVGFTVVSHKEFGFWKWRPDVGFYLSETQKDKNNETHGTIKASVFYQELIGKNVASANVLDFLLAHPQLIPEDWVLPLPFCGTIYRDNCSDQCFVRCLIRYEDKTYGSSLHWLGAYLGPHEGAMLLD